jgi:hypothetical protein
VPTCSGLLAIVRGPIRNTNQESARTAFKRSEEKFDRVKLWGKRKGQSDLLKQSMPKPHSDCVAGKMQIIAVARDEGRSKTYDALERDGGDAAYALWSTRSDVRRQRRGRTPRSRLRPLAFRLRTWCRNPHGTRSRARSALPLVLGDAPFTSCASHPG